VAEGVAEGEEEDTDVAAEVAGEDDEDDEDDEAVEVVEDTALLVVSSAALVMLKMLVAESVMAVPSCHTAMANMGETERSFFVSTSQVKLVASTWSSAERESAAALASRFAEGNYHTGDVLR
jgi:hypothetical protein